MKKIALLCCALFASLITLKAYANLADYDVEKRKIFNDFIFLPIKGSSTQGSFIYTRYKKVVLPATSIGSGWRSVTLSLTPVAIDSPTYNDFILNNRIVDNRKNLIPTDANLCVLSSSAKQKLAELKLMYITSLLIGGYPKACSLTIRYFAAAQSQQETAFLTYLSTNNVVSLSFKIEEVVSPAITVSFHDIVYELHNHGVLKQDSLGFYSGSIADVSFHAMQLPSILFGATGTSPISLSAWSLFFNAFTLTTDRKMKVTLTSTNQTLSVPAAVEEIANVNATL